MAMDPRLTATADGEGQGAPPGIVPAQFNVATPIGEGLPVVTGAEGERRGPGSTPSDGPRGRFLDENFIHCTRAVSSRRRRSP